MAERVADSVAAQFFGERIMSLPAYVAGKASPDPSVIKVASNEMPFEPLPGVREALIAQLEQLSRYPDLAASELREAIAQYHGVTPECVAVGNGSVALIERILADVAERGPAGEPAEVVMPWRSFEAYPIAIQLAGARAVPVPLRADGACDLEAMLAAVTPRTRALLVCTPNNPSSAALTHTELRDFLRQLPARVPVLLDEAYVDFVQMDDPVRGLELLAEFPNVISLRTFSKAYGLAALRCGYAIAEPSVVRAINSSNTPFGVNMLAQAAAVAALGQRAEVDRRVAQIVVQRDELVRELRDLGWAGPEPQGNFVWFELGERASEFAQVCACHGIVVRTFASEGVRVTVAEPEAQQRLVAAYKEFAAL